MSWLRNTAAGDTPLERVLAHRPNLHDSYRNFYEIFWQQELLPARILELCRLRIAQLHDCRAELARFRPEPKGLESGPALLKRLRNWHREPDFDDTERACLEMAELFVQDPHAISDPLAEAVIAGLGEPGYVAFAEALAILDSSTRIQCALQAEPC